jgi:hypothetical protein
MLATHKVEIEAVEVVGCGHTVYLSADHIRERRRDHQIFYCTHCGRTNYYPGKSDLEKLRGQLASTQDMLNTVRADRDRKEYSRRAEKAAKTRIKNRISKGVCPCCNRTFQDLQRHMTTKHPDYATTE